jgi:hypothetical protein
MPSTLRAVIQGDHIQWEDDPGKLLPEGQPINVLVTILDSADQTSNEEKGARRIAALQKLAALGAFSDITDPVAWQREIRKDRDLPGRQ